MVAKSLISSYSRLAGLFIAGVSTLTAQFYELEDVSFENPEFRKRFIQGYLVGSDTNPTVSSEERVKLEEITPLISSNPTAAIQSLRDFITPDTSAAFDYMLASLLDQEGNRLEAVPVYKQAIKKLPRYYQAYFNIGRALTIEGDYDEAVKYLQEALRIQPGDGVLFGLIGYCYLNSGRYTTAFDAYNMAIMLQPDSMDWKQGKLNCLIELGRAEEAIAFLYEFIDADPDNATWWKLQANQFLESDEPLKAASNLTVVKDMGKADTATLMLLGDILVNDGIYEAALDSYETAMANADIRVDNLLRVTENLILVEESEYALELIEKLEGSDSFDSDKYGLSVLNQKAQIAMATDEPEKAITYLEEIVSQDPLNGQALLTLANYHTEAGDYVKAAFYAEDATKLEKFEHKACISLAQIKVKQQDYREAAKYLRRAQSIDPRDYVASYLLKVEQAALRM